MKKMLVLFPFIFKKIATDVGSEYRLSCIYYIETQKAKE